MLFLPISQSADYPYLSPTLAVSVLNVVQTDLDPFTKSPRSVHQPAYSCIDTSASSGAKEDFSRYFGEINHVALSHMNADLPPVSWRTWREMLSAGSHMPSAKPHQTTSICNVHLPYLPFTQFILRFLISIPLRVWLCPPLFCLHAITSFLGLKETSAQDSRLILLLRTWEPNM